MLAKLTLSHLLAVYKCTMATTKKELMVTPLTSPNLVTYPLLLELHLFLRKTKKVLRPAK